ncbi:MAG TPA: hypothetical protein VKB47_18085 [Terracidiphilus sp.]|nr:hypothetical protein [Terracidiphilus sp.]
MKFAKPIVVILVMSAPLISAKDKKKHDLPAVFSTARYVYVQAEDGGEMNPGLLPEDRDAIASVQSAIQDWKRYAITLNRKDADLVFIVRKGRLASARVQGDVGVGTSPVAVGSYPGRNPMADPANGNPNRSGTTEGIGARAEAGPSEDFLRVFALTPDGKLNGPVWSREMKDGLDEPDVLLIRILKDAVEKAYPPQAASQPSAQGKP